jgi:hypothetical protein
MNRGFILNNKISWPEVLEDEKLNSQCLKD